MNFELTFDIPKVKFGKVCFFSTTQILYLLASNIIGGKLLKPMLSFCIFDEENDDSLQGWDQDIICFLETSN